MSAAACFGEDARRKTFKSARSLERTLLTMDKLKIVIAYDGSHFRGWQIQPGEKTVQDSLELAIEKIAHAKIKVHGSGRTDSGVHALGQVAHFEIPLGSRMTAQEWQRAIECQSTTNNTRSFI